LWLLSRVLFTPPCCQLCGAGAPPGLIKAGSINADSIKAGSINAGSIEAGLIQAGRTPDQLAPRRL